MGLKNVRQLFIWFVGAACVGRSLSVNHGTQRAETSQLTPCSHHEATGDATREPTASGVVPAQHLRLIREELGRRPWLSAAVAPHHDKLALVTPASIEVRRLPDEALILYRTAFARTAEVAFSSDGTSLLVAFGADDELWPGGSGRGYRRLFLGRSLSVPGGTGTIFEVGVGQQRHPNSPTSLSLEAVIPRRQGWVVRTSWADYEVVAQPFIARTVVREVHRAQEVTSWPGGSPWARSGNVIHTTGDRPQTSIRVCSRVANARSPNSEFFAIDDALGRAAVLCSPADTTQVPTTEVYQLPQGDLLYSLEGAARRIVFLSADDLVVFSDEWLGRFRRGELIYRHPRHQIWSEFRFSASGRRAVGVASDASRFDVRDLVTGESVCDYTRVRLRNVHPHGVGLVSDELLWVAERGSRTVTLVDVDACRIQSQHQLPTPLVDSSQIDEGLLLIDRTPPLFVHSQTARRYDIYGNPVGTCQHHGRVVSAGDGGNNALVQHNDQTALLNLNTCRSTPLHQSYSSLRPCGRYLVRRTLHQNDLERVVIFEVLDDSRVRDLYEAMVPYQTPVACQDETVAWHDRITTRLHMHNLIDGVHHSVEAPEDGARVDEVFLAPDARSLVYAGGATGWVRWKLATP